MKFTLIKNIREEKGMLLILQGFLVFVLLYLIVDTVVAYANFGLTTQTLSNTLFGNEEEYIDPLTPSALLEFWHTQIFFMMMILLTLNAIFIRAAKKSRIIMTNLLMMSAISSLITLPLTYFISKSFLIVYIGTFYLRHITAIFMVFYLFWKFNAKSV